LVGVQKRGKHVTGQKGRDGHAAIRDVIECYLFCIDAYRAPE